MPALPFQPPTPWPIGRRGCVFYDAHCAFCRRQIERLERMLGPGVVQCLPLQSPGAAERGRQLLREVTLLMGYEITRDLPMTTQPIETPNMPLPMVETMSSIWS